MTSTRKNVTVISVSYTAAEGRIGKISPNENKIMSDSCKSILSCLDYRTTDISKAIKQQIYIT